MLSSSEKLEMQLLNYCFSLPQICDTDADCGNERCCIKYLGICAPKRGLEESCNFSV